ncbi:MAG: hypothetical protein IJ073_05045, partial [Lachnospiraceae bacterium]|nr:hypothetical protein [Lachnospiraceae bacterium]
MFRHRTLGESLINWFSCAILALTILVALIALFTNDNSAEAAIGSFQSTSFDEGWVLEKDGQTEEITLPYAPEAEIGELVTMKNTLPDDIADQSSLLTRASMEDIFIYIDGKLREQYATEAIPDMAYHIPSAYVVATLNSEDSGKEIVIQVRIKARGVL